MLELIWVILSPLRYLFNINNNNNINNNKSTTPTTTIVYKNINKPNYIQGENEDSIPLQIKSLTYLFHRFKFYNLKPLLIKKIVENDDNDEEENIIYDFDYFNIDDNNDNKDPSYNILINEKLDSIYNIHYFKNQFLNDPYKILVDYNKNKFRSLLILSNEPTNNINNNNNINYQNQIPINSNFKFLILNPINSINNYIDIIINNSNIYIEHKVNKKIKIEILKKIIKKQLKKIMDNYDSIDDSTIINFSKDDRAIIISTYVQKLAFHIQVQRLYKATLKKKAKSKTKSLSNRYSTNNLKNFDNINNYRKLKNKKSSLTLLPETSLSSSSSSTTKINDLSILNSNDDNDDDINYYSDNQDSQASSSTNSSINYLKLFTDDEKQACFKDIKLIVRICIERQRNNYI